MQDENNKVVEAVNPYNNATQAVADAPTAAMTPQRAVQLQGTMMQIVRSANWFYWIAGLSLVNLLSAIAGANFRFVIGLGFSEVLSEFAKDAVDAGHSGVAMYAGCVLLTGFFAACGWLARRPSIVAFVIGMVAFAADTLIFVMSSDWLGVIFHGMALFYLWRGIPASQVYKKLAQ
jgi:hypothetical protein